ncbi:sulfatase modifying factor 1 (C-alpha-formyglycine- generating enzyme 1) [Pseudaminobacter manganicus]|uniref:Sulfatase modifying factor 1 (C-alpha-formyglycine-generating enzyme 1) n=1 Tax=Manganibacter manganicus TaxID=1873176 RepID=A0A1V8RLV1_9HYPH|nr:sulfatase modifying factor 1 (C-alpha-formyglycine- generating enzyme 1) [Pseudaminobacter manganicus]
MVWLGGGRSYCGTARPTIKGDGEEYRSVRVQPFGIDRFAVTNARFLAFVEQTGYRTEAEAYDWSFVFKDALDPVTRASTRRVAEVQWWHKVDGANWKRPAGPKSSIDEVMDHPVVHVSWNDAVAFAEWAGGRLLTEGEWEFAARGDKDVVYPWGNEDSPEDNPRCNIWQGSFPDRNLATDGHEGTAPTNAFEPNGYGLYNMVGNTWEWCTDPFRVKSLASAGKARNAMARREGERLLKGGSFLCHRSYCHRYRIAARMGRSPNSTTSHIGFRLGYDGR